MAQKHCRLHELVESSGKPEAKHRKTKQTVLVRSFLRVHNRRHIRLDASISFAD